jgi:phosphate:Na+ symporter
LALGPGNPAALRLPVGNLFTRVVGCLIALPLIGLTSFLPHALVANPALSVVNFHLIFNLATALIFFPFLPAVARGLERYLRDRPSDDPATALYLDPAALKEPHIAINNAVREVMRMTDVCESMLRETGEVFTNPDRDRIEVIKQTDDILDRINRQVIAYLSALNPEALNETDRKRAEDVLTFSMNLEHIGDVISNGLVKRAAKRIKRQLVFSEDDQHELDEMFERITQNIRLASAVFMTSEDRAAQALYKQKQLIEDMEISATRAHFNRLRDGRPESLDTSSLHLDVMRDLKLINAQLVATAHQVKRA